MLTLQQRLQRAVIRLRHHSPFYGVLAMYGEPTSARHVASFEVLSACTDGKRVYFNPDFAATLSDEQLTGVLVHEVLHAALLHVPRAAGRNAERWNIAADIIVNGIAAHDGYVLPQGAVRRAEYEHLSVEEVYALLEQRERHARLPAHARDVLSPHAGQDEQGAMREDADAAPMTLPERQDIQTHWRDALQNAAVTARLQGHLPGGAERALQLSAPKLDWRAVLWRFLTPSRTDFDELDLRLVHRGLYLEDLASHDMHAAIGVDTSGSVSPAQLSAFLSEVRGILGAYPHVHATLYYADVTLHGPFDLQGDQALPAPVGHGGTDFRPFLNATQGTPLRVYLTDGHGTFPPDEPPGETLWVVTPGGLSDAQFPFGRVVRLIE